LHENEFPHIKITQRQIFFTFIEISETPKRITCKELQNLVIKILEENKLIATPNMPSH